MDNKLDLFYCDVGMAFLHLLDTGLMQVLQSVTGRETTHVQYTRSVTGRKRGDDSRRIVTTDCLDRHTGSHVAKRASGSELQVVYT